MTKELLMSKIEKVSIRNQGGQQTSLIKSNVRIILEDLGLVVDVGCFRSGIDNNNAARKAMELLIDEYLKK